MVSEKIMARWESIINASNDRDFLLCYQAIINERLSSQNFEIQNCKFKWAYNQLTSLLNLINDRLTVLDVIRLL